MASSPIQDPLDSPSPSPSSSPEFRHSCKPAIPGPPRDSYFGNAVYESPSVSDSYGSDSPYKVEDDDAHTDSTLDDMEANVDFGHPLQRMPRTKSADHGLHYDSDAELKALLKTASSSQSSVYIPESDLVNYDRIIDILLEKKPNPFITHDSRNLVVFDSPLDDTMYRYQEALPPLMVKRFKKSSSSELFLFLELNVPELREDPWNASPHIVRAVERDDHIYLCMQRLFKYNSPPLVSVAHYIDFFRQVLEGLSFLHEQHICGLRCAEPSSYMVDLSSTPHTPAPLQDGEKVPTPHFDRFAYPVRYYFVDFSQATRISNASPFPGSFPATPEPGIGSDTRPDNPFRRDVQDCGAMFNALLLEVPPIAPKFKSLTKAMTLGGFTADDARRLFEALCRSLDAEVFEKSALPQSPNKTPGRAHTISCHLAVNPRPHNGSREKVISR